MLKVEIFAGYLEIFAGYLTFISQVNCIQWK